MCLTSEALQRGFGGVTQSPSHLSLSPGPMGLLRGSPAVCSRASGTTLQVAVSGLAMRRGQLVPSRGGAGAPLGSPVQPPIQSRAVGSTRSGCLWLSSQGSNTSKGGDTPTLVSCPWTCMVFNCFLLSNMNLPSHGLAQLPSPLLVGYTPDLFSLLTCRS